MKRSAMRDPSPLQTADCAPLQPGYLFGMSDNLTKPRLKTRPKVARPPLHKVILVNDDFTPREFVVTVLKAEFGVTDDQATG